MEDKHSRCLKISQRGIAIFAGFVINSLIYFDKGALASIVHILKSNDSLDLTLIEVGLIGFIPIVGYILGIPLFALAKKCVNALTLMGLGLLIWTASAVVFAIFESYYILLIARAFTGLGEAAFTYLAPTYIIDIRDQTAQRAWYTSFFSFWWFGYGLGYLSGTGLGYNDEWMALFSIESGLMFICAILLLCMHLDPILTPQDSQSALLINQAASEVAQVSISVWSDIRSLISNRVYISVIFGYIAMNFTISGYVYWGTYYFIHDYDMDSLLSLLLIGLLILCMGIFGSIFGLYQSTNQMPTASNSESLVSTHDLELVKSVKTNGYLAVMSILGSTLCILAVSVPSITFLVVVSYLGFVLIFMQVGSFRNAISSCVKPELKWQANFMCVVLSRVFGEFASSLIVGAIGEAKDMYVAFIVMCCVYFIGSICWILAWLFATKEAEHVVLPADEENKINQGLPIEG